MVAWASLLAFLGMAGTAAVAIGSSEVQELFRQCEACQSFNCVEITLFSDEPWWSCCAMTSQGSCNILAVRGYSVPACHI